MFYFLLILLLPALEITAFILVGGEIGAFNTLLLCIATTVIGVILVKRQGIQTLQRARAQLEQGQAPEGTMFDGLCLFLAGALLIIPGFITDALGFALLIPPVRGMMKARIAVLPAGAMQGGFAAHSRQTRRSPGTGTPGLGDIIEGDYVDVTEKDEDSRHIP